MSKTTTQEPTMSTKDKAVKICADYLTLRDRGLTGKAAIARIASDSNTEPETIVKAMLYAMAA